MDLKLCAQLVNSRVSRCNYDIFIAHNSPVSCLGAIFLDACILGAEQYRMLGGLSIHQSKFFLITQLCVVSPSRELLRE